MYTDYAGGNVATAMPPGKIILLVAEEANGMDEGKRLEQATARMHPLWGGKLCLDFANTVEPRGGPAPVAALADALIREYLKRYLDLVAWALYAETVTEAEARRLLRQADRHPDEAEATFQRATTLREAIYRIFWAVANNQAPAADDVTTLQHEHAEATLHAAIVATGEGFQWRWETEMAALARPIWPIAWSATELLIEGDLGRIKVCPGVPGQPIACAWLFYDATKNRLRHWCSMEGCGAAAKARRQTDRRRAARRRVAPSATHQR